MAESMVGLKRTHRCTEVSGADIGSTVTVMGWVAKRRNLGSLIFVDLRDRSGILQILFDENIVGKEGFDKAYTLRNEFVIAVVGKVVKRSGAVNENLKTGDIEIAAESLRILSESETPPFPIEDGINTKEDIRLKYRCLDLRRPDIQSNIIMRSKVATLTRAFLAKEGFLEMGVSPIMAPDKPTYVTIHFEKGIPTAVDGVEMNGKELVTKLNELGGANGIGLADLVENRLVGMKSRGVYETPGGTILMEAHDQLEELVLDRATMEVKKDMGNKMAQIVYEGKWFTPLREACQAFIESTQKYVTGEVKFKLYKGNIIKAGTTSKYSLYSESLASFTTGDLYDHHDASGFITLFGLPLKVRAMKMQEIGEKNKYED